jgi:hypothetical protein
MTIRCAVRLSNSIKDQSRFGYSEESGNMVGRRDEALKIGRKDQPDDAAAAPLFHSNP